MMTDNFSSESLSTSVEISIGSICSEYVLFDIVNGESQQIDIDNPLVLLVSMSL